MEIIIEVNSSTGPGSTFSVKSNGKQISGGTDAGIHVVLFNATNGKPMDIKNFDTESNASQASELETFIKESPLGSIVAIATCGSVVRHLSDKVKRVCTTVGSYLIHSFNSSSMSWALVGIKGAAPAMANEKLESGHSEVTATIPLQTQEVSTTTVAVKSAGFEGGNTAEFVVAGQVVEMPGGYRRGLNAVVIDEQSFAVLDKKVFDTHVSTSASEAFVEYMKSIPLGRIVSIAVKDEASRKLTSAAKEACTTIGSSRIHELRYRNAWAIVGIKGASVGSVVEALCNDELPVQCLAVLPIDPLNVDGVSVVASSAGYTDSGGYRDSAFASVDGVKADHHITRGITLAIVEPSTGTFARCKSFDTYSSKSESTALVKFIDTIQAGKIVVGLVSDEASQSLNDDARMALQQIGSSRIRDISHRYPWAIVGRKGCPPGSVPELHMAKGVVAVQLVCRFDSATFARPYYCLRAASAGYNVGDHASISVDYKPILSRDDAKRGLNVVVFDGKDYSVKASGSFDTYANTSESDRFVTFITQQENGSVIAIAAKDEASWHLTSQAKQVITSLGSTELQHYGYRNSWSMIATKGYVGQVVETLSSDTPAHCCMCLPCGGILPLADSNQVLLKAISYTRESSIVKTDQSGSQVLGGGTSPSSMTVISIDPLSQQVTNKWTFATGTSDEASQQLVEAIEGIPSGVVVAIAGCGDIVSHLSDRAKQALESVGSGQIQKIKKDNAWTLIGVRGAAPGSVCECMVTNAKESVCMLLQSITMHCHGRCLLAVEIGLLAGAIAVGIFSFVVGVYYTSQYPTHLAVSTPSIEPPERKPSKKKALLVGITYAKGQSRFLYGKPPAYARRLRSVLANTKTISLSDITLLTDKPEPTDIKGWPSRTNIEEKLKEFCSSASEDDVFLFYYCGHGGSNKPTDGSREEYLITLNKSGSGKDVLYDKRLNEITASLPSKTNLTFIFHACFSGGMFDRIPSLPHPMKGIALTAVDGTIPAVLADEPEPVDITTIVRDTLKKKSAKPTYKQLYDKIHSKTTVKGKVFKLPDGTKMTADYEPQMYYNSSFVTPDTAKFLEQFP